MALKPKVLHIILFVILFVLAAGSMYVAFNKNVYQMVDCQIDGSAMLIQGNSPYSAYIADKTQFQFSRIPTHLPQSYYLLAPFAAMGDQLGTLAYGIVGILLLFLFGRNKRPNLPFIFLVLALLASQPYRNNIGNGQFLFFFFPIFLLFDRLTRLNKDKLDKWVLPILLVALVSKPTAFFWVVLFYPLNKRFIRMYATAFLIQLGIIFLFARSTNTMFTAFFQEYAFILSKHASLTGSVQSVFSINFETILQSLTSVLVLVNLLLFFYLSYLKFIRKMELDPFLWMFACIVLSFILVYHRNYDSFMLLLPLFVLGGNVFQKRNVPILCLFAYLIVQKLVFKFVPDSNTQLIFNNFCIVLLTGFVQFTGILAVRKEKGAKREVHQ